MKLAAVGVVIGIAVGGCGGGGADEAQTVKAVVQRIENDRTVCVDPIHGGGYCTTAPDARNLQGVDPGECVEVSRNLSVAGAVIRVLPERDCS
jgi:hypothetical protein